MNVDRKSLEFTICRQSGKQTAITKNLFLTVFDLRSSIASTFSIATYSGCVLIQGIRNQNNLKQELGVIYIFSHVSVEKKVCFHTG